MYRNCTKGICISEIQRAELGLANPHCVRQHGLEHRLQLSGRAAYDLEHVGGRRLLLQRFAQLVQKPRILNRDDGLSGEVRHQLDLLVGERAHFFAVDGDGANQFVLFQHRNGDQCAGTGNVNRYHWQWIAAEVGLIFTQVDDMDSLPSLGNPGDGDVRTGAEQFRFASTP